MYAIIDTIRDSQNGARRYHVSRGPRCENKKRDPDMEASWEKAGDSKRTDEQPPERES
jgi:hypothetical protein